VPLEKVVADANVLLAATVGKAAQKIFSEHHLEAHASEFNAAEVKEYLPLMAKKYGLPLNLVILRWRLLPLTIHKASESVRYYKKALEDLKMQDPEDAHALALARALAIPIWSNDRHLAKFEVSCLTTARLLKSLTMQRGH
jgi:predicted nucleic acid-binding protein